MGIETAAPAEGETTPTTTTTDAGGATPDNVQTNGETGEQGEGGREPLSAEELMEDSLRMNAGALVRHAVRVVRDFHPVPLILGEKGKVLQILVNLIRNAKYAADEGGHSDKTVSLHIAPGAPGRVRLTVQDNGVGIPAENLTRIFCHGFTTRANGHGFGLHSSANAAKEMKGSLTAYSDGPGLGASFVLDLPEAPPASPV